MTKIGLIRCEKNESRCPLTGCINTLTTRTQGFAMYDDTQLVGFFTCHCPGDNIVEKAKILKSKGAEAIHLSTCTFAHKEDGKWVEGNGFCEIIDDLAERISKGAQIPCVKGSAHLPKGYQPEKFE